MSTETRQKLLNESFVHMMVQGCASVGGRMGECRYRNEYGHQCAAGLFITEYSPDMEGAVFTRIAALFPHLIRPDAVREARFVREVLQVAHDTASQSADFTAAYKRFLRSAVNIWNYTQGDNLMVPEVVQ